MKFLRKLTVAALAAATACGGGGDVGTVSGPTTGGNPSGGNPTGGSTTPVATNQVAVSDNSFGPANIVVSSGTTVTWTWDATATTHNVTFSDAQSGDKGAGATYSRTFSTAGTFNYNCTLHAGMAGSVKVN
jgi:plastocyanin